MNPCFVLRSPNSLDSISFFWLISIDLRCFDVISRILKEINAPERVNESAPRGRSSDPVEVSDMQFSYPPVPC